MTSPSDHSTPGRSRGRVVIIGAGPAGLSAAVCLRRLGIEPLLLERGDGPLAAFRRVDPDMRLLSPRPFNRLPGMAPIRGLPFYPTFSQLTDRYAAYATGNGIEVAVGCGATRVIAADDGFVVETSDGSVEATHVVNATGIISSPRLPQRFDPPAMSVPWKHSLDVRTEDLSGVERLLVVGGGASAAEVLDRWLEVRPERGRAWLSLRSRLLAFRNPLLGLDVHFWIWLPERLPAARLGWRVRRIFREAMNGTHVLPAIRRGVIAKVPAVARWEGERVAFESGDVIAPDLVVFATGFRYHVPHLAGLLDHDPDGHPRVRACRSTRAPRLFLLGYKFSRTFASPYLRGIARDAGCVARQIARDFS